MTFVRRSMTVAAVLAVAAVAAGCGGGSDSSADTDLAEDTASPTVDVTESTPETTSAITDDVDGAPEILQFSAPLVGGGELDAASLATKPTAFWFWSPT